MAMIEVKNITKSFNVKKFNKETNKYEKDILTVLRDFTVDFTQEGVTVLLGPSGTGKSTLINLIMRLYDVDQGSITLDGVDLRDIQIESLHSQIGVVLQETNLFTGTVMENIRYGNLDATDEECIQAAKLANAHDFITRLPQGYDTELTGNGASLSQGQRQLIAIARAAVADPPGRQGGLRACQARAPEKDTVVQAPQS